MQNPYEILGVEIGSSQEVIKAAYKRMAMKTHPDKTGGDDTEFKKVSKAYETLTSPPVQETNGIHHHHFGFNFMNGFPAMDPNIANMFHSFHTVFSDRPPADRFKISIPLSAIINGTSQRINVDMPHKCDICSGSGCQACKQVGVVRGLKTIDVCIPPGTQNGSEIRIPESGSYHKNLGRCVDVILTVCWKVDPSIRIYGNDIHLTLQCSLQEIMFGFSKSINIYDADILISRHGYESPQNPIVVKGAGILNGDIVVNLTVTWPDSILPIQLKFEQSGRS